MGEVPLCVDLLRSRQNLFARLLMGIQRSVSGKNALDGLFQKCPFSRAWGNDPEPVPHLLPLCFGSTPIGVWGAQSRVKSLRLFLRGYRAHKKTPTP